MKAVMVMFDSLNRGRLPGYGGDEDRYPNFARLARRTAVFERSYVCSMPCMPARRDFHTGRPNFMHTPWSPLQPFDDSVPEMLDRTGVSTHLITDHYHYFEDGGSTYHGRYNTWQHHRGQEGDPWIGMVEDPPVPPNLNAKGRRQDWVNRQFLRAESDFPQVQTFDGGIDFLERNHAADNWFLQIETFDPHEPFTAPPRLQEKFPHAGGEPLFDWPGYQAVTETPEEIERLRDNYAALTALCDEQLGRVLDAMDRHDLWKDTMLIVWTDHGFLLGEHGMWAKNHPLIWDEIGRTPFYVWDPRHPECAGRRRTALVQPAIDLGPTLLRFFGQQPTARMTGHDLAGVMSDDSPVREVAVYGYFGRPLHVTDGRWVHIRDVQNFGEVLYEYNMMPVRMRSFLSHKQMQGAELVTELPFSRGQPVIRYPRGTAEGDLGGRMLLYDRDSDPGWERPMDDPEQTRRMADLAADVCRGAHAPVEWLRRFGL